MSDKVSLQEKRLRQIVCLVIQEYEPEYVFHNSGGHFVERIISHLGQHRGNYEFLPSSITIALLGCYCKDDGLSIPSLIRSQIADKILTAYQQGQ